MLRLCAVRPVHERAAAAAGREMLRISIASLLLLAFAMGYLSRALFCGRFVRLSGDPLVSLNDLHLSLSNQHAFDFTVAARSDHERA